MLKRSKSQLFKAGNAPQSLLEAFVDGFKKVTIDQPIPVFNDQTVQEEKANQDYGIMGLLEGDWYSYVEPDAKRVSNDVNQSHLKNVASGIHTTIMPSPGMDSNKIPGKFAFVCDEYIEKLSFEKVAGGVRNRGGMNEQFCTAIKYDQTVRSVNRQNEQLVLEDIHAENGMYLTMSDLYAHMATDQSIQEDRGVHRWDNESGIKTLVQNLYPNAPSDAELARFKQIIRRYPYLDVVLYNVRTLEMPAYVTQEELERMIEPSYVSIVASKELRKGNGALGPHFIPDYSISRSGVIPHGSTITVLGDMQASENGLLHHGRPQFIHLKRSIRKLLEDFEIPYPLVLEIYDPEREAILREMILSRCQGDLVQLADGVGIHTTEAPAQSNLIDEIIAKLKGLVAKANWEYKHMALSKTMGGGISPTDHQRPFPFEYPVLPFQPLEDLNEDNDSGEEEVYVQRLFLHPLYPYTVRPDLRLKNAIANSEVKNHVHVQLTSNKKTGAQGGVLNIPFVERFVPTQDMRFNLYIETLVEDGKEFLQIQYEQIIFFEFGFGDGGGTTSWPHIQVNTLRRMEDLNDYSRRLALYGFIKPQDVLDLEGNPTSENVVREKSSCCPFHNP